MDELKIPENTAETMRDVMETLGASERVAHFEDKDGTSAFTAPHLISLPQKRNVQDLTSMHRAAAEYLKPARRLGTAKLADLASLINWAERFKGETSALFASPNMAQPTLTCIADYHAQGAADINAVTGDPTARHCHHRAVYDFPLSEEWQAWMNVSGIGLGKDEMGEFIEARAQDVLDPTPAMIKGTPSDKNESWENRLITTAQKIEGRFGQLSELLAMSRQFQVYESSDLKVSTNRDTGEAQVEFTNEHKDATGQKLNIPNLITIAIPVFQGGAPYRMAVRFRYRKSGAEVKFILSVYNPEKVFEAAFDEAVTEATEATGLPTFKGLPES